MLAGLVFIFSTILYYTILYSTLSLARSSELTAAALFEILGWDYCSRWEEVWAFL